ncbi:Calx-beta domain-containing protein [Dongshaea marina]|uniref:Calx-beta domain-containing protein n=1 Tax=Dongshaea marina TaxID=2047966 RepID=UPI000D3E9EBC|nr:Calx-beta domain-containing protein [Dongshaea marina]
MNLSNPSLGQITDDSATATITDQADADALRFSLSNDVTVAEGQDASFAVSLSGGSLAAGQSVTMQLTTAEGTAVAADFGDITLGSGQNASYDAATGTLTINGPMADGGEINFSVPTVDDTTYEGDEQFSVNLSNPSLGQISDDSATATITDQADADALRFSLSNDVTVAEGQDASFAVSLSGGSLAAGQSVTMQLTTAEGTAVAADFGDITLGSGQNASYDAATGTLTINGPMADGGEINFSVPTVDDTTYEGDEQFSVNLSNPSLGQISDDSATATITDQADADALRFSLSNDVTVAEGQDASFAVSLSGGSLAAGQSVTMQLTTAEGTAVAADFGDITLGSGQNASYDAATGTLIINGPMADGGEINFSVPTVDDTTYEGDEQFSVNLSNPSLGQISDDSATATITDQADADALRFSLSNDVTVAEGQDASFAVSLSGGSLAAGQSVTMQLTTAEGTAVAADFGDITLGSGQNASYDAATGTLTINGPMADGGEINFSVPTVDDTTYEGDEQFSVNLSNPSLGQISDDSATATITDQADADALRFSLSNDVTVAEGQDASFAVSLSGGSLAAGQSVTMQLTTAEGTAVAADFGDITLGSGQNASYDAATGTLTINGPMADGGEINFSVPTVDDTTYEGDEQFSVNLSNPSLGQISDDSATATITDQADADALRFSLSNDVTVAEGQDASFAVSLSGGSLAAGQSVTMQLTTAEGTAVAADFGDITLGSGQNASYDAATGTLTINGPMADGGEINFSVPTVDDTTYEGDEQFSVNLSNPSLGQISDDSATATITDQADADALRFSLSNDVTVAEGQDASFAVSLSGGSLAAGQSVTMQLTTAEGTAVAADFGDITLGSGQNASYDAATGTLTINGPMADGGEINFSVPTVDDTTYEGDEQFSVNLSNPSLGQISDDSATATITDQADADALRFSLSNDVTVAEGQDASFAVSLSGGSLAAGQSVTMQLTTAEGTAVAADFGDITLGSGQNASYDAATGTLTINGPMADGGEINFSVPTVDDTTYEGDEQFSVNLSNPSLGQISDDSATATITDQADADALRFSLSNDVTVAEGQDASFAVSLSGGSLAAGQSVTMQLTTAEGTAVAADFGDITLGSGQNASYDAATGTLTINGPMADGGEINFSVPTVDDTTYEGDEQFSVNLSNPSLGQISDDSATATITDQGDADALTFSLTGTGSVAEGAAASYSITLGGRNIDDGESVTLKLTTEDGSALKGVDFEALVAGAGQSVVYDAVSGELTVQGPLDIGDRLDFTVNTIEDNTYEGNETYQVNLGTVDVGSVSGSGVVETTITDTSAVTVRLVACDKDGNIIDDSRFSYNETVQDLIDDADNTFHGTPLADQLVGSDQADAFYGDALSDQMVGHDGNDVFISGEGDEAIYGGHEGSLPDDADGTDTVIYKGNFSDYTIRFVEDGTNITLNIVDNRYDASKGWAHADNQGLDTYEAGDNLYSIEKLIFNDGVYLVEGGKLVKEGETAYYKTILVDDDGNLISDAEGTVDVTFTDGTATVDDYSTSGQTMSVNLNEVFSASALEDNKIEATETYKVSLNQGASNVSIGGTHYDNVVEDLTPVVTNIIDDDSLSDITVTVDEAALLNQDSEIVGGDFKVGVADSVDVLKFNLSPEQQNALNNMTSEGQKLDYSITDDGTILTSVIHGTTDKVFEVTLNSSEDSTTANVKLYKPVDHAPGQDKNELPLKLGVEVTDTNGHRLSDATLTVNIKDSVPDRGPDIQQDVDVNVENTADYQVVVMLDVSGSMQSQVPVYDETGQFIGYQSSIQVALEAIEDMLFEYAQGGDVTFYGSTFSNSTTQNAPITISQGSSMEQIKSQLGSWEAQAIHEVNQGQYTDYDQAASGIESTVGSYGDMISEGHGNLYFISDGESSSDTSGLAERINNNVLGDNNYFENNWSIGIGFSSDDVAHLTAMTGGDPDEVITVDQATDLSDILVDAAQGEVRGDVIDGTLPVVEGGTVHSIEVQGHTYFAQDYANKNTADASDDFVLSKEIQDDSGNALGKLTFNFETGDYKFKPSGDSLDDFTLKYDLIDTDGDISGKSEVDFNLVPVSEVHTQESVSLNAVEHQLVILLDTSGSMGDKSDPNSNFSKAQESIVKMAYEYAQTGSVVLHGMGFASSASAVEAFRIKQGSSYEEVESKLESQWFNALNVEGGTNYQSAAEALESYLAQGDNRTEITDGNGQLYFISDGQPTEGFRANTPFYKDIFGNWHEGTSLIHSEIDGGELLTQEMDSILDSGAFDNHWSIGVGGVDNSDLQAMAGGDDSQVIPMNDFSDLDAALEATIPQPETTGDVMKSVDGMRVNTITIGSVEYKDPGHDDPVKITVYEDSGSKVVGTLDFNFSDGTYSFVPSGESKQDFTMSYDFIDSDGDVSKGKNSVEFNLDGGSCDVWLNNVSQEHGYDNSFGVYTLNAQGEIDSFQLLISSSQDIKGQVGQSLGASYETGEKVGFFIINNEYADATVTQSNLSFDKQDDGSYRALINGVEMDNAFFTNASFNADGKQHFQIGTRNPDGTIDEGQTNLDGSLTIGIEDQYNLGPSDDKDYTDVVFDIKPSRPGMTIEADDILISSSDLSSGDSQEIILYGLDDVSENFIIPDQPAAEVHIQQFNSEKGDRIDLSHVLDSSAQEQLNAFLADEDPEASDLTSLDVSISSKGNDIELKVQNEDQQEVTIVLDDFGGSSVGQQNYEDLLQDIVKGPTVE